MKETGAVVGRVKGTQECQISQIGTMKEKKL